ncbi:DUF58 domain-containing protein [Chitiniphilus purpureus]|uniref:DUF58 domain-containing protein n=1 Tax=Chitiniphilus purpureus TaxID=2981137 RepID=A0ABY6DJ19_9NEIS|nr:DUF58 domain-containing protein [Chitiniphilus sp. CD1]UXY14354.1 DUF58 domain-containing protein [Chitiniphilus sp. CD1]
MQAPAFLQQRWQRALARRHPPAQREVRLRHNRIYVLPSLFGFAFAASVAMLLIGAINYQLSLGYLFTFGLIGLGHASLTEAFRNLLGLRLVIGRSEPVFVGESAVFTLVAANDKRRIRRAISIRPGDGAVVTLAQLPGNSDCSFTLAVPASQRGWLTLPRLRIETRYPTGFCRAWSFATLNARCLVYPAPEAAAPPYPGTWDGSGAAARQAGEDEFAGLRDYRPGDSPRRIAWKRAATSETLSVKTFDAPQGAQTLIRWEAAAPLGTEQRLARLAAWLLRADSAGERYGLALPGTDIALGHGPAHLARCLTALALFETAHSDG